MEVSVSIIKVQVFSNCAGSADIHQHGGDKFPLRAQEATPKAARARAHQGAGSARS